MFDRMAAIINLNKAKLREIFHNKYLWGFAGVLLLVLVIIMLLQPGQKKHFQTAHQELTELAGNIREHYKVRPDYWGLDTASALKNKLVPVSMLHHDKVISAIGREVILGQDADGNMVMPGQRNFMITIPNLSKTACVAMLSHPFKKEEHLGLLKIMLAVSDKTETFEWGGSNPLPITPKTAEDFCKNKNNISWIFE